MSGFDFETGEAGNIATTHDWLTPPELLAKLGDFDLDPCASQYQPWRTAATQYTIKDNGLSKAGTSGAPSVFIAYGKANAEALKNCGIEGAYVCL